MSGPAWFQTRIGQVFLEGTMPKLVRSLERIADALEKLVEQREAERADPRETPKPADEGGEGTR
jgi:hypothetical protein